MASGRTIVAIGGSSTRTAREGLWEYVLSLAGEARPRVCLLPTASADDTWSIVDFYERYSARAELSHVRLFPWPPAGMRELVLSQDVVFVGGGNTANLLALWRVHGLDAVMRDAWERGIVLAGVSAGAICWFEACVTDSFGPELAGLRDGLGFLAGSACPHYDGEERRRPRYHELVAGGFPGGLAADDSVALHFRGTGLAEVLTARPGATAYRVELVDGRVRETPLDARVLQ